MAVMAGLWCASPAWPQAFVFTEAASGLWNPYSVAPGSLVLIHSTNLAIGPATGVVARGFPLITNLAGTSAAVRVGGRVIDLYILATEQQWTRALLPSTTPLGDGTLVVTYNGSAIETLVRVVERQLRLYDGSWCRNATPVARPSFCVGRAVQNLGLEGAVENTLATAAKPGQLIALWGTGLGAVRGDEAAGPVAGHMEIAGLAVMVGNQRAKVVYAGRSGCCAGMDEIIFEAPEGIEGCKVPVWVRYDNEGHGTQDVYLSFASGSEVCGHSWGLTEADVRKLAAGATSTAQVVAYNEPGGWGMAFSTASEMGLPTAGTCVPYSWGGIFALDAPGGSRKDAGEVVNLQTPTQRLVARRMEANFYGSAIAGAVESGQYTMDNGRGGAEVAAFRTTFAVPPRSFSWTNREQLVELGEQDDLRVTWSASPATAGFVLVGGLFGVDGEYAGGFLCYERPEKGEFTVPAEILARARSEAYRPTELTLFTSFGYWQRITIPEIDIAELVISTAGGTRLLALK